MQYCALNNGQQQQFGSNSQRSQAAPHFTKDVMGNQQAVTARNVLHLRAANARVQPPQSAHFNLQNGAHPARQTLNGQTSAGPTQTGGGNANGYFFQTCNGNLQSSSSNVQSGNPGFRTSYGYQVARQQDFHQNSQSQSTRMTANTVYSQQDMSPYWKRSPVAHERPSKTPQNVCTNLPVCATPNSQTIYNQLCRQNGTQHGLFTSTPRTTSNMATSLSFRNTTTATNLSPNAQVLCNTNNGQKTQQYPAQLSSSYSSGVDANNSPNLNSYNYSKASFFLTKAKDTVQQQMLRDNMSPAYLVHHAPQPDGPPPSYIVSTYGRHQCVGNTRMTTSNQNTQPVTSALTENYNPDYIQGRPLHSGQSLTVSPENAMSRATHPVNVPSHQNSAPNVFCSNLAGDGNGRSVSDNAHHPINKTILTGVLARLLIDTPPVSAEATSPQMNNTQLSTAQSCEIQEMQSSVKQNDNSVLMSPGHTGTRAVAVVQPLTLESYTSAHTSSITATGESSTYPEKLCILPSVANPALVTLETVCQNSAHKSVVDIGIAKTTQKPVVSEAHVGPHSPKDQNKMETPPTAVFELSSLPTTAWTAVDLAKLIQDGEKTQMNLKASTDTSLTVKLLHLFWNKNYKELLASIKSGRHFDITSKVHQHFKTQEPSESVILRQVKEGCMEKLKNCHVLKHDEVYSEAPYKSSWLNVNEQLSDVYNEFDCEVDQMKTASHILAPISSDVPKKVVPGTELGPVNSSKEKQAYTAEASSNETSSPNEMEPKPAYPGKEPQVCTVTAPLTQIASPSEAKIEPAYPGKETKALTIEAPSTQTASQGEMDFEPAYLDKETRASTVRAPSTQTACPDETEPADSSDEFYSFKIEVLPPEEAKRIFVQIQGSVDTVSQAEDVRSSSVEGATLSKSKPNNGNIAQVDHICCVTKWMELILGSDIICLDKCKCKEEESPAEISNRALNQEKNDDLCGISKVHPTMAANNQTKAKENVKQMTTSSHSESLNELIQIIDLTQDDNIPHISPDQEPKNIPLISNNTQSNIVLLCESENEDLSNTETEIPKTVPDVCMNTSEPGDECVLEDNKSDETEQLSSSVSSEKQPEDIHSSDVSMQMSGHSEPVDLAGLPIETKGQAQISEKSDLKTFFSHCVKDDRKRKTLSSQENFFPLQKKSKKCKRKVDRDSRRHQEVLSKHGKVSPDVTQACPSLSNVRTAELVLFGSVQNDKGSALKGTRKSHVSSACLSNEARRPPEVLSVTLGQESSEAVSREERSAKRLIYENWKKSFQVTNIGHRNKLKTQQCPSASPSGPSSKKGKSSALPRRRASLGNVKRSRDLYREKRSLSHEPELGEKTKEYTVTRVEPAEHDASKGEGINVLRFSVLPNTFTFKDGSSGRKETTDPLSGELRLAAMFVLMNSHKSG